MRKFTENSANAHLDGVLLVRLDRVEPHQVPGQAPGQPRQRGAVLDRLAAVVYPDPLRGNINVNNTFFSDEYYNFIQP